MNKNHIKKSKITIKIEKYQGEVINRNCRNFRSCMLGATITTGIILFLGVAIPPHVLYLKEYLFFFLYSSFMYFASKRLIEYQPKNIVFIFYLTILPLYLAGILMGTVDDPKNQAITFMVLLFTLTIFIIDKPWRMATYLMFLSVIFLIFSYFSKPFDIFHKDLVNLIIYLALAVCTNYFSLKERVEAVENYAIAKTKSEIDCLTSIYNRGTGEVLVKQLLHDNQRGSFVIIDIDNFKNINDTFGHRLGDEVLVSISTELKKVFRPTDIVWRLGGDEFAIYAISLFDEKLCKQKFEQLAINLKNLRVSNPDCKDFSVSIGCTINKKDVDFDSLYKLTDKALYSAKTSNKGRYIIVNN